jgi:site-specific DNA-methyltransferase (adenine-specific)
MSNIYYQDDAVTIYHGDCRDILPHLEPVDLVLTDPPYGMDYISNRYKYGNPHDSIVGDNEQYPWGILLDLLSKTRCALFAFMRWDNLISWDNRMPKPKSFIVWAKNNWTAGDLEHEYGRSWEAIAFYPREFHQFCNRPHDVIDDVRVPTTALVHPTQKPVNLIKKLLIPNAGETILDPFMGSGTTLRAAKDLGRKAIGIEIKEKYCEMAAKRMSQSVMELNNV